MLFKTLSFGVATGFAFLAKQTSAQYDNHHQQFLHFEEDRFRFDTKALTPVGVGDSLEWAFASTIASAKDQDLARDNTLLVKLKGNMPLASPFDFEWAREYFDPEEEKALDVEDVFFHKDKYILCGKVAPRFDPDQLSARGFLLEVAWNGSILQSKLFAGVSVFRSVIPTHDGNGYVAVGKTITDTNNPDMPRQDAVYVQVDGNLDVVCSRRMEGEFFGAPAPQGSSGVESAWNKVIPYFAEANGRPSYAIVGETYFNPGGFCRTDEDVIVGMVREMCDVKWVKQYGSQLTPQSKILERGFSLAQLHPEKGGLVITGNTTKTNCGNGPNEFEDILAFTIDGDNGNQIWWFHYDIISGEPGTRDVGTAVQIPGMRKGFKRRPIMIAGESETRLFPGATYEATWDAFLLEIDWLNGNVYEIDVFGLNHGVDNGALPPGKLDLHLSKDLNFEDQALLMGNTKWESNNDPSYPYIVERYHTVQWECKDTRFKIQKLFYEAHEAEVKYDDYGVESKYLILEVKKRKLFNKIVCEKGEPEPTKEPTPDPTPRPTERIPWPTLEPSPPPTNQTDVPWPTSRPTHQSTPTPRPTEDFETPTQKPTVEWQTPTPRPTEDFETPTPRPTEDFETPTHKPTVEWQTPTQKPTVEWQTPTPRPTEDFETPTQKPTEEWQTPTPRPTEDVETPTHKPTEDFETPTHKPTEEWQSPTPRPTEDFETPTHKPTEETRPPRPTPMPTERTREPRPTPRPTWGTFAPRPTPRPSPRPTRRTRRPRTRRPRTRRPQTRPPRPPFISRRPTIVIERDVQLEKLAEGVDINIEVHLNVVVDNEHEMNEVVELKDIKNDVTEHDTQMGKIAEDRVQKNEILAR